MKSVPHIRWMIRRDLPDVLAIEQESFDFPWPEDEFIQRLRQRNCIGKVAELNDRVVGYMVYALQKSRIDLLTLAVAPDHRRAGIGSALMAELASKLSPQRRRSITLVVNERNIGGQLFFARVGFRASGVVSKPYEESDDDGYRMVYRLREASLATEQSPRGDK